MSQKSNIFQLFTYSLLIGLTCALIGKKVFKVRPHQFHFAVSILQKTFFKDIHNYHLCTGTIIRQKSILTTAHCLEHKKPHDIEIIAGAVTLKEGKRYFPESWITFDQWNHNSNWTHRMNDIAVIILQGEGITDIPPVPIAFVYHVNYNESRGLTITGWGETEKGNKVMYLRAAQLTAISNEECGERGTILKGRKFSVPPNYFCSRADPWVLSSNGDGGAPVFTKEGYVIGMNIGICPNLEGYAYTTQFLHENQLNSHLHLYYYMDFIQHVWK